MNHKWYRPNFKCFKLYLNTISWGNIHFIWFCHFWAKMAIFIPVLSIFPYFRAYLPFFPYFYPIFGTWNGLYISRTIIWKNWDSLIHIWSTTSKLEPVKVMKMLKFWLYFEKKKLLPYKKQKNIQTHNFPLINMS